MISITSNGNAVALDFRRLGLSFNNVQGLMKEIAGDLDDIKEKAFEKERDPVTRRPWAKLKPSTIEARRRKNKLGKKLQVTGRLVNSITTKYTATKARIGTNLKYAGVHQRGNRGRNIPQRRFIGLSPGDLRRLRFRVNKYLINKYNSA